MSDKVKIILADDHQLFRKGIKALLEENPDFNIIGEAEDGQELITLLETLHPNIVLIDISMPHKNGLEVMKESKSKFPDVKFIVLTMHTDGHYVAQSVKNGAMGYLMKNTNKEELFEAINEVLFGRKYFNKEISSLLINAMALQEDTIKKLSQRESEVLKCVAEGFTTKQIASDLCISTRTVETHRINIMKKLNVSNTAEMINKAKESGII